MTKPKTNEQSEILELKKQFVEVAEKLAKIGPLVPQSNNMFGMMNAFAPQTFVQSEHVKISIKEGRYIIEADITLNEHSESANTTTPQNSWTNNPFGSPHPGYGGNMLYGSPFGYGTVAAYGDGIMTEAGVVPQSLVQVKLMRFTNQCGKSYWTDPRRMLSELFGANISALYTYPLERAINDPIFNLLRATFVDAVEEFNKTCEDEDLTFKQLERQDCVNEESLDAFVSHYREMYKSQLLNLKGITM